jgi:hypothetical protein
MTTSVSRPDRTDSIASRWPGRSDAKPNASRATRSIRPSTLDACPSGAAAKRAGRQAGGA